MGFAYNNFKKICKSLGHHNDALYAVLAIATFKGVMRPTFTMMDKHSDKETKKYAAFREGLTEVIAFCSYIATHSLVKPLAFHIGKKTKISPKRLNTAFSLISVCLSAGLVIPAVCNLTLKPIMDGVKKLSDKRKKIIPETTNQPVLDVKENSGNEVLKVKTATPPAKSGSLVQILNNKYNMTAQGSQGMKVGL